MFVVGRGSEHTFATLEGVGRGTHAQGLASQPTRQRETHATVYTHRERHNEQERTHTRMHTLTHNDDVYILCILVG